MLAPGARPISLGSTKGGLSVPIVVKASVEGEGSQQNPKKVAEGFEQAGHAAHQVPENAEEY